MASYSERYHEYTKYNPETISRLGPVQSQDQAPLFKEYLPIEEVDLIDVLAFLRDEGGIDWSVLQDLEHARENPFSFLASLIYFTAGITNISRVDESVYYLRANPSAGGLYPTEIYLAVRGLTGMRDGIYAFQPLRMSLALMDSPADWDLLETAFWQDQAVRNAKVVLFYTARLGRCIWRYKERAYRRMVLDTGHAWANSEIFLDFHKVSYQILEGFNDCDLGSFLRLNLNEEVPLMAILVDLPGLEIPASIHRSSLPRDAIQRTLSQQSMLQKQITVEQMVEAHLQSPLPWLQSSHPDLIPLHYLGLRGVEWPKAIRIRRSCRNFELQGIPERALATMLHFGIQSHRALGCEGHLESYLAVRQVDGLAQGVYRLSGAYEALEKVQDIMDWDPFVHACLSQEIAVNAAAILVHACDLNRVTEYWGDRGYRKLCLLSGRIGERIQIAGTALGIGVSGVGGYYDDLFNDLLGLEGNRAVLFALCLGAEKK